MAKVYQGGQLPSLSTLESQINTLAKNKKVASLGVSPSAYYAPVVPTSQTPYPSVSPDPNRQYPAPGTNELTANFPSRSTKFAEIPTSSSAPKRPRTVAAAYAPDPVNNNGTLTVVFRDGTYYNYYDVNDSEWNKFHGQLSKGPMLNPSTRNNPMPGFLMSKPRGEADVSNTPADVLEALHRRSTMSQLTRPNRRFREQVQRNIKSGPAAGTRRGTGTTPSSGSLGVNNTTKGKNTSTKGRARKTA